MNEIKEFFHYLDYVVATFWGITVYDILPQIGTVKLMDSVDGVTRTLFAIVGLIYFCARLVNYVIVSRIKAKLLEEDLIDKHNKNQFSSGHIDFYNKFNKEFNKEKE